MNVQIELPESLTDDIKALRNEIRELKENLQPKEPTKYLTRQAVAEMLSVDISSIHNWTVKKILTSYQIGGRIYYKRTDIEAAIIKLDK